MTEETQPLLETVLNQDISKVEILTTNNTSLFEHFPDKELIIETTELQLMQILLARRALIAHTGFVGEQIKNGTFLNEESQIKTN